MKEQEIIKQIEAIINSELEDIFFVRGEMMVKCVMSIESLKIILEALKKQTPQPDLFDKAFGNPDLFCLRLPKKKETEDQRQKRLMKYFRD